MIKIHHLHFVDCVFSYFFSFHMILHHSLGCYLFAASLSLPVPQSVSICLSIYLNHSDSTSFHVSVLSVYLSVYNSLPLCVPFSLFRCLPLYLHRHIFLFLLHFPSEILHVSLIIFISSYLSVTRADCCRKHMPLN